MNQTFVLFGSARAAVECVVATALAAGCFIAFVVIAVRWRIERRNESAEFFRHHSWKSPPATRKIKKGKTVYDG